MESHLAKQTEQFTYELQQQQQDTQTVPDELKPTQFTIKRFLSNCLPVGIQEETVKTVKTLWPDLLVALKIDLALQTSLTLQSGGEPHGTQLASRRGAGGGLP